MATNVYLVRNGETAWRSEGKLLGRQDLGLTDAGRVQAKNAVRTLGNAEVNEIVSSPLARATQTATAFAKHYNIQIARDPRLTDIDAGPWQGHRVADLWANQDFRSFVTSEAEVFPGGEKLQDVRSRVVGSIQQALIDNPAAVGIVVVSHAGPLRIALAHYLGIPVGKYHRLRISPGAISVVRFESDLQRTRVLAINWAASLADVIADLRPPGEA
ncbi:MAG: histidine phosphatase family protein [Deltaproteobacteria bacterium]|nr:histidine phosphatase family protein [Deltaproteobacteria bacterium]